MYFSRITFNPLVDYQSLAETLCRDTYREHQALWSLFDDNPDVTRDFLYRQVQENGRIKYYVLSKRIPVDKSGMWLVDTPKPYCPKLVEGQKLFFMLRVNPVITVTSADGKKHRHDAIMHEKKRVGFQELPKNRRPALPDLIQDCGIHWLAVRSENNGFSFSKNAVIADGYRQHQSRAKKQKAAIRYSTLDFQGALTVTDPERFNTALLSGIGKSKAFGCGLMLVRKI
jgi:CRISPR system Cascade subunit CasE